MQDKNIKFQQWLIIMSLALVWGSSFILMKKSLICFTYTQVAALRLCFASAALLPLMWNRVRKIEKKYLGWLILSGFLGHGIPAFLFTKAQTQIDSSLAGVLNSLTPLFALIVGVTLFKAKTQWWNALGVGIGFLGAVLLVSRHGTAGFFQNAEYGLFIVLATLMYSFNLNIIKKFLLSLDSITISGTGFLIIGPLAAIYLFNTDITERIHSPGFYSSLLYVAILGIVGSALSIIVYNHLIKISSVLLAASVTYIIPVFALMWGIADGEIIRFWDIVALFIIICGVYLVNRK